MAGNFGWCNAAEGGVKVVERKEGRSVKEEKNRNFQVKWKFFSDFLASYRLFTP